MLLILTLITTLACLTTAVVVHSRNTTHPAYKAMTGLTVCLAAWSIANFFSLQESALEIQFFWIRTVMAVTIPIPWLFLYFTLHFPVRFQKKLRSKRGLLVGAMPLFAVWTTLLMALSFTPVMFTRYWFENNLPQLDAGPGVFAYGATFFLFSLVAAWLLFRTYIWQEELARLQSAYILLGLSLTVLTGFITNFVFVMLFNNFSLVELGPSTSLFLVLGMSYAMLKHRLLDLKLAVLRFLAYVSTLLVITLLYSFLMTEVQHRLVFALPSFPQQLTLALSMAVSVLCFPVVLRRVQQVVQHLFYKSLFKPEQAHQLLSQIIGNTLTTNKLQTEIDTFFCTQLGVEWTGVVTGHDEDKVLQQSLDNVVPNDHRLVVFDEINENRLKQLLRERNIRLVIPLSLHHHVLGWVYLGPKHSGDAFSAEELRFCVVVGPQLALAFDHLHQVDRMKDDFVSIASHELRTPMTAIKSYLWLCLFKPSLVLPESVKQHLQTAYSATERLLELVRDLLTLSQIEAQQLPLKPTTSSLLELAQQVAQEIASLASKKGVTFTFRPETRDSSCVVDQSKVVEILHNLLGNAVKFSPDGGVVAVEVGGNDHQITVSISDQGPGISKHDQERLFHKFGIIQHSYLNSTESGTGLGLYIAQQFAKLHNGLITTHSVLGEGTTFTLSLPRTQIPTEPLLHVYAKKALSPTY